MNKQYNIQKTNKTEMERTKESTNFITLNNSKESTIELIQSYNKELNFERIPNKKDQYQESDKESISIGINEDYRNDRIDIYFSYDNIEIPNNGIKDMLLGENYDKIKWDSIYYKYQRESFNLDKNILREEKEIKIYKKVFDRVGLENIDDDKSDKSKNEFNNLYYIFEEETNTNNNKIQISYRSSGEKNDILLNKKRKASREKEKKYDNIEDKKEKSKKNENFILKFLTNFINVYEYKKLVGNLQKINIFIDKCDRKKFLKAKENYLPILLKKNMKELFGLENKLKENFPSNEEEEKTNKLLESTFEEELKLYYKSDELKKFKIKKFKDGKTPKDYDKIFYAGRKGKVRGYYLLEPYGFIIYANSEHYCKNERKRNIKK